MLPPGLVLLSIVFATAAASGPPAAPDRPVTDLLDSYARGSFDEVVEELNRADTDFDDLLRQLRRNGPGWIDEAGLEKRAARELAAATFALEAARAGEWREWKGIYKQPPVLGLQVLNVLYWQAPPLLIEWGCELFRRHETPRPVERWWQLAALAVAQRSEDTQFLVGDPNTGRGVGAGEIGNTRDEIKHLDHVAARFPNEMRFVLAQGIARDRAWPEDAEKAYLALENDPDVGGEAMMRLGAMRMRQGRADEALERFERAEFLTRDPYVVFLARYFSGQVYERRRLSKQAEAAYGGAVAAVPHAQSATLALAALVARDGRHGEAERLVAAMLSADPRPFDPWRAYVHADDRFWPQLIARLRAEILK